MKIAFRISLLALIVACSPKQKGEIGELINKRDSLQTVNLEIQQQINNLNKEIALKDSASSKDELILIKKIAIQKNRVVKMSKKVKMLENELASIKKSKNLIPIAVKELEGEAFNHYITVYGRVEASNFAQVAPEIGGQIRTIHVRAGDKVSKGQLLVSLNTDAVKNSIKATKTSLELAQTTFKRQDTLYKQGIGSEIQYLSTKSNMEALEAQFEMQKAQLRMSQIRAPFNGYVDKIHQKEGALASSMMPVLDMVNLNKIQIKADVSEAYVGDIKKGQVVELGFSTLPDLKLKRPIVRTSKVINQSSRTFEIEVHLDNHNSKIKPNMVSSIQINDFSVDDAMVIPTMVIRKDISGDYVYVVVEKEGELVAEKRSIETSYSYDDKTLVTKGLKKGDRVVIEGYHLISSGVPVKVIG